MVGNSENISDERLASLFKNGDSDAFDELVHRYYKHVYRFLVRFTGREHLSEDLTQEVFLKLYRSIALFDETKRFKPWLFTVAANRARDELRSMKRASQKVVVETTHNGEEMSLMDIMPAETETPERQAIEKERSGQVREAMMKLSDRSREILILAYYEKMQYSEIAEVLDIPLGTVKSRLHKAVSSFGKAWESYEQKTAR